MPKCQASPAVCPLPAVVKGSCFAVSSLPLGFGTCFAFLPKWMTSPPKNVFFFLNEEVGLKYHQPVQEKECFLNPGVWQLPSSGSWKFWFHEPLLFLSWDFLLQFGLCQGKGISLQQFYHIFLSASLWVIWKHLRLTSHLLSALGPRLLPTSHLTAVPRPHWPHGFNLPWFNAFIHFMQSFSNPCIHPALAEALPWHL